METKENKGIISKIYNWFKNLTIKSLLGLILLTFIIIIILISVSYLPGAISKISSSFSAALYSIFIPAENATMTANKKIINSGEDFDITFKKGEIFDGIFTVSYSCDLQIELFSVESAGLKKVNCDTRYYLLENETNITLRAITEENIVRLVLEGAYENNENQKIETVGVARITVKNENTGTIVTLPVATSTPATTITSTSTTSYIPPVTTPVQPIYYGKPDLAIRVLQVGKLNQNTNQIITNQNQFTYSDMVGIKFVIRNDGDANTGNWAFTANLPSLSTPIYNSNNQISLRPGESIIYTLGFSNLTNSYNGLITIKADSQNTVIESNEYNNTVIYNIINLSYGSNYYTRTNCSTGYYYNGQYYYTGLCLDEDWNYNNLSVSCYADPDDPEVGERVRWYAEVEGGDGDYEYDWTGTNGLDSSSKNPSKTYTSRGTKRATVTVTDGDNNEESASCTVYVD